MYAERRAQRRRNLLFAMLFFAVAGAVCAILWVVTIRMWNPDWDIQAVAVSAVLAAVISAAICAPVFAYQETGVKAAVAGIGVITLGYIFFTAFLGFYAGMFDQQVALYEVVIGYLMLLIAGFVASFMITMPVGALTGWLFWRRLKRRGLLWEDYDNRQEAKE